MNETTQQALEWAGIGISPIPIRPRSKKPIYKWSRWKNEIPSREAIVDWFRRGENLGLVCGGKKNLCVLDFDNMKVYCEWLNKAYLRKDIWKDVAIKSFRVKTGRGMHVYVTSNSEEKTRAVKEIINGNKVKLSIDIKADGGFVLAPPSVHPSGHIYTALNNKTIFSIPSTEDMFPIPKEEKELLNKLATSIERDILDVFDDDSNVVDIVKNNINIVEYVSRFTTLKKTGEHWYTGRCINPNHKDRNPSFRVNTETQKGKCFSSSCPLNDMAKDVIGLNMFLNGINDYIESANYLAEEYGLI